MGYKNIDDVLSNLNKKSNLVKHEKLKKYSYNAAKASVDLRETNIKKAFREESNNIRSLKWMTFTKGVQEPSKDFLPIDVINNNSRFHDKLSEKKRLLSEQESNTKVIFESVNFFQHEMNNLEKDYNLMRKNYVEESVNKK